MNHIQSELNDGIAEIRKGGREVTVALEQAMQRFYPQLPLAVAYSGGADSSALLHACARRWPGQIVALHVHHGLQAAADAFEIHCRTTCSDLNVPLSVIHVDARHQSGQSPEDVARRYRYAMLAQHAQQAFQHPVYNIALAQHADDQVETLLLALSRGAGVAGLAAMPAQSKRHGHGALNWYRPLLEVSAKDIRTWLLANRMDWIEDPTNADTRFTRNRIRAELLPVLERIFPQFRDTFARSCTHAAQAKHLLSELAQLDADCVGIPPNIPALRELGRERRANVLRYWLLSSHDTTPSAAQLRELLRQIDDCRTRGQQIRIRVGSGFVVRNGMQLGWYNL